jgi:hypothetical protein
MPEDRYGNVLTTSSREAAEAYSEAVDTTLAAGVGALQGFEAAIEADPEFALAHAGRARMKQLAGDAAEARRSFDVAEQLVQSATPREQRQVASFAAASRGNTPRALELVYEQMREAPRDAFMLSQASGVFGLIGFGGSQDRNREQFELLDSVRDAYGEDWWYLSALAFAHNELYEFEEARRLADRSYQLRRDSGHAAHTLAHIMYETGGVSEGRSFLGDWLVGYAREAGLYNHLSWHQALFLLLSGDEEAVEAIYRDDLRPEASAAAGALIIIADAASLQWRRSLAGAGDLGWDELAEFARTAFPQPGMAFGDVHCAFALAAAADRDALGRLIDGLRKRVAEGKTPAGEVVPALAEGIAAFANEDYEGAVAILEPVQEQVVRIGGSHAQREVFEDTLLEAYIRAGRHDRAVRLLDERLARRPSARDADWRERATADAIPAD